MVRAKPGCDSIRCSPRASSSALAGRGCGSLAMHCASSRSSESGTSARRVRGGGGAGCGPSGRGRSCRRSGSRTASDRRAGSRSWRPGSRRRRPPTRWTGRRAARAATRLGDADVVVALDARASRPAMPKSVSAGSPYCLTRTLAGLMSRCMMPARWAVSTALASWMPVRDRLGDRQRLDCDPHRRGRAAGSTSSPGRAGRPLAVTPAVRPGRCRGGRRAGPSCRPRRRTGAGSRSVEALGPQHLDRDPHPRHLLLVEVDVGEAAAAEGLDVGEARDPGRVTASGAHALDLVGDLVLVGQVETLRRAPALLLGRPQPLGRAARASSAWCRRASRGRGRSPASRRARSAGACGRRSWPPAAGAPGGGAARAG